MNKNSLKYIKNYLDVKNQCATAINTADPQRVLQSMVTQNEQLCDRISVTNIINTNRCKTLLIISLTI